jgi:outer membrane beta-barrel protein
MYTLTLNLGRAFGEYWEVYLTAAPSIYASEREIFKQINNQTLSDGSTIKITYAKPKSYYGMEVLWAPLYGKDALGPRKIIRSDMFLKMGAGVVQFEDDSGFRTYLMAGKTFFITKNFNLRLAAGAGFVQTPIDNQKKNQNVGLLEFGNVWYF